MRSPQDKAVVAYNLGRQWIGIDVSPTACNLTTRKMRKLSVSPNAMGTSLSEEDLRRLPPFKFQKWVIQRLFGRMLSCAIRLAFPA